MCVFFCCYYKELFDAFTMFDKNGDGMISADELGRVLFQMGKRPTLRELQSFVRSVDADSKFTTITSLNLLSGVGVEFAHLYDLYY